MHRAMPRIGFGSIRRSATRSSTSRAQVSRALLPSRPASTGIAPRSRQRRFGASSGLAHSAGALPVLDYALLRSDLPAFASELNVACRDVGFFVLANLPEHMTTLHHEVLRVARLYFDLQLDIKKRIDYVKSPQFRGYMRLGTENTAGIRDEREQIELGVEEPVKACFGDDGPNQWPDEPADFRDVVQAWLAEMESLSRSLTTALSVALGLDDKALDAMFLTPHVQAKLVHYPAISAGETETSSSMGVGPHSDSGFLTLLLQDSTGGLEVLSRDGQHWLAAHPMPSSLICNLGEVLQLLSGDTYLSTVHRVVRPIEGGRATGRISAPYFWNPSLDTVITPLVGRDAASRRDAHETSSERPSEEVNRLLPAYGMNALKSLARSHPRVLAMHHPDLRVQADGLVVRR
eukprot:TRINITY_DN7611_c0_g1_i2.p1 TRINITY_DN7611_c0_g1~~TRINITY_DN7611_c0_g1_i2.p1  ORF type:complete len:405 (-),score=63.44 TRINITY_DN7611_c0_g1_i2:112-1326(-)